MSKCAWRCMEEFPECCFAYGESDEFSFVMSPNAKVFSRRKDKITTSFASLFSSSFVFFWKEFYPDEPLLYPPIFDGRMVIYPTFPVVRDYVAWRQADCHINNLYNTAFWALVDLGQLSKTSAEERLSVSALLHSTRVDERGQGTSSEQKNEILFSQFGINYNNEPAMFRKGSVLYRGFVTIQNTDQRTGQVHSKKKQKLCIVHEDIIGDAFWIAHQEAIPDNSQLKGNGK